MATRAVTLTLKRAGPSAQKALRETAKKLGNAGTLNVGFLASAKYPNGLSVPQNAFWQEFGTKFQPPRPFMRRTIAAHAAGWGTAFAKIAKAQHYDAKRTLTLMGIGIQGQIQQSIKELTDPPLSPVTVKAKGFDKPLIESAVMIRSVDFEVVAK